MPFIFDQPNSSPQEQTPTNEPGHDVRKLIQLIKYPQPGSFMLAAHRGYRYGGVPENSKAALRKAAEAGFVCVEIDIRLTADKVPVLFRDTHLGRVTNIAEHMARTDIWSPFTGKGYNPKLSDTPWHGVMEHLKVKEEHGHIVEEGVLTYEAMLDFIKEEGLNLVLFLDIKDKAALPIMYEITKTRTSASGVPAIEWAVWKLPISMYSSPEDLEKEEWWQDAMVHGKPAYIPVFRPASAAKLKNALETCKAWAHRPYTLGLEIGCRNPNGPLRDMLDWAVSPECPINSIGFYSTQGDLWEWDGKEIMYDTGDFEIPWKLEEQESKFIFTYNDVPKKCDDCLLDGESPDGHDHRHKLELYKSLGYTWTTADNGEELRAKGIISM
ncbi:hypothetical protein CI109_103025 [Kwoniella shandongensis]|uniref:Uncharacterized protein n=1 Tax=Kwoniella shandongensis TaxID=1734106 RepID=A0A5M6CC18_9TREE|nr:uncharacterized protein CI109_000213 [Kwoniella shandongensis]KAA5531372.1 hypothetical protein CI109_000213 [Kwoniella shandongensis]